MNTASGWRRRIGFWCVLAAAAAVAAPAQTYSVLYTFTGGTDGGFPQYGRLIVDATGNLYGTTAFGGDVKCNSGTSPAPPPGCGVVFKLDPASNAETVLYTFSGGADGSQPWGGLVRDLTGNLYGTTAFGGVNGAGTIFKVFPSSSETVLHAFNGSDGSHPTGDLLFGETLWGTTVTGGHLDLCSGLGGGVVFGWNSSLGLIVVHRLTGQ